MTTQSHIHDAGSGSDIVVPPGRPSEALVRAVERAAEYARATKARATQVAYAGDWRRFCEWAAPLGAPTLPAPPEAVAAHLAWLADEGCAVSSVERTLAAIRHHHKQAGEAWYRGHPVIADVLEGIRRRVGTAQVKKAPLRLELLEQAVRTVCRPDPDRRSLMDRALLTVGFFGLLRSANLVAIERAHVRFEPEGVVIHLPTSKTDQRQQGRDLAIHRQAHEAICPVAALQAYLPASGLEAGLIFPVSRRYVARLVKRAVAIAAHQHAGIRAVEACAECRALATSFSSHSLRHGFATAATGKGVTEESLMKHGGWKSERVARGYVQRATPFENNPTKGFTEVSERKGVDGR